MHICSIIKQSFAINENSFELYYNLQIQSCCSFFFVFFLSHRYGGERYSVFRAYLYLHLHKIVSEKGTQGRERGKIIPPSTLLIFILRDEHIHRHEISLDILYSIYGFVSLPFLFMFSINLLTHFCCYLNESNIFSQNKNLRLFYLY